jgi:hypothetical protein
MSLPDYNFIPAPLWLITALHILTLALHFIAMNLLFGSIVIVLWGRFTRRWEHPVVQRFINLFPSAMAATVTLGVAPLLFVQLVYHRQLYAASIVSAWFWLLIFVAVIFSYYFLYAAAFGKKNGTRKRVYLILTLVGLVYVSFVYSSVFSLAEKPALYRKLYTANQSGFVINPDIGGYIFRWLHMLLGAVTVGGFFIGLIGRDSEEGFRTGKTFFLWGMAAAALFGFVYLIQLGDLLLLFMRTPAIWTLTIGIVLSVGALHFFFKKKFWAAGGMLFVSLLTMVYARHTVRLLRLRESFDPSSLQVSPQWTVFALFLICFVVALGVIAWMIRAYFREARPGVPKSVG